MSFFNPPLFLQLPAFFYQARTAVNLLHLISPGTSHDADRLFSFAEFIAGNAEISAGPDSGEALFVNLNGGRLTRQGFWKIVKGYAVETGITKEITPHTIRHSFALHLLENGASVKDIQTMMGHADISSTQVYVQLLDSHVNQVYHDCHPKAQRKLG